MTYLKLCAGPERAPCRSRALVLTLTLWVVTSTALAHSGHLELKNFYIDQMDQSTYLYGQILYPENDTRLELQAVGGQNFSATLEGEKNGRWQKVSEIPLEGDLTLNKDSAYRLALPTSFDFAALKGKKLPFSFLFGAGGAQIIEVQVGPPSSGMPLWIMGASGLLFGFVARWAWQRRFRRSRR
jgi:hypothetical protein